MRALLLSLLIVLMPIHAFAAEQNVKAHVYKNPQCFCCDGHAEYLRQHGFSVAETATTNLAALRKKAGVPEDLEGCHMTFIDGYVIEGHVPIGPIQLLLNERPKIKGISLPGMPEGSPGMSGEKSEPFVIYEIGSSTPKVFAIE